MLIDALNALPSAPAEPPWPMRPFPWREPTVPGRTPRRRAPGRRRAPPPAATKPRLKRRVGPADIVWVRICDSCQCPAPLGRDDCAFAAHPSSARSRWSFSLQRIDGTYGWYAEGVLVASAPGDQRAVGARRCPWRPGGPARAPRRPGRDHRPRRPPRPADRLDPPRRRQRRQPHSAWCWPSPSDGLPVLILRTDGGQGAHLVDRRGDVVAIASWEHPDAPRPIYSSPPSGPATPSPWCSASCCRWRSPATQAASPEP